MDNLRIYNKVRAVPKEAQKPIQAGRLKGKTDINPMWRIKALTDQFGPVGLGWYYEILEERLEEAPTNEIAAFVKINLYVKYDGEWSKPIQGTGGSSFVANEKNGPYVNDECFKMALTDAISVACKALGFGADIYWASDNTKYIDGKKNNQPKPQIISEKQLADALTLLAEKGKDREWLETKAKCKLAELPASKYDSMIKWINANA